MADSSFSPAELCSWKAIAAYLGVSVKTAQLWESQRGLPVHRLPGPRTQVRASVIELEAWRASTHAVPDEETGPTPALPLATAPSSVLWRALPRWWWLLLVAVLVFGYVWALRRGVPVSLRVEGDALVALDERGGVLWRAVFGVLDLSPYASAERRSWLGDLDGDGAPEVLFVPVISGVRQVPLVCFDARGRERWRFLPGREVRTAAGSFDAAYRVRQFAVLGDKIVVTSQHHLYYPNQVAVLSAQGRLLREYWHSGHLNKIAVGDNAGKPVVYLGGISNAREAATLVVLDPVRLGGASVEEDARYQFQDLGSPVEIARFVFPRSCMNQLLDPYNAVFNVIASREGVTVDVHERIGVLHPPSVLHQFDRALRPVSVGLSDLFLSTHASLHAAGQLDHDWQPVEVDRLRGVVRLP